MWGVEWSGEGSDVGSGVVWGGEGEGWGTVVIVINGTITGTRVRLTAMRPRPSILIIKNNFIMKNKNA